MESNWFLLAVVAMVSFAIMNIIFKKVADMGVKTEVLLLYTFAFTTIIFAAYIFSNKIPISISSQQAVILLIITAVLAFVGNTFSVNSLKASPNPGYTLAVTGTSAIIVAIAAIFIFQSEFTLIKGVGVILAVLGIILIGL